LSFFPPKLAHIHGMMTIFSFTWRFRKLKGVLRALLHSEGPRLQRFDQQCIDETTCTSIEFNQLLSSDSSPKNPPKQRHRCCRINNLSIGLLSGLQRHSKGPRPQPFDHRCIRWASRALSMIQVSDISKRWS
jgi:hypothetical protein